MSSTAPSADPRVSDVRRPPFAPWSRPVRFALALALVAIAAVVVWDSVKYRFIAKRWGVVVPGRVYRSGQLSRWMLEPMLARHNVGTIVDLQGIDPTSEDQEFEIKAAERLGVELLRFPLAGNGTGDIERYADAVQAIAERERAGQPVLVHCAAGSQRTGGVVAAYRLLVRGDSPEEAYAELERFNWDADTPLVPFLNAQMRELAQRLVERGVIERVPEPLPQIGP